MELGNYEAKINQTKQLMSMNSNVKKLDLSQLEHIHIWNDTEKNQLENYMKWHREHPHSLTPRELSSKPRQGKIELPSSRSVSRRKSRILLSREFQTKHLGSDGKMDEVARAAAQYELMSKHQALEEEDLNPWYHLTVNDSLTQYHLDGSSSATMKYVAPKKIESHQLIPADEVLNLKYSRVNYQGGSPWNVIDYNKSIELHKLSQKDVLIKDKSLFQKDSYKLKSNRFLQGGTALQWYLVDTLEIRLQNALKLYEEEMDKQNRGKSLSFDDFMSTKNETILPLKKSSTSNKVKNTFDTFFHSKALPVVSDKYSNDNLIEPIRTSRSDMTTTSNMNLVIRERSHSEMIEFCGGLDVVNQTKEEFIQFAKSIARTNSNSLEYNSSLSPQKDSFIDMFLQACNSLNVIEVQRLLQLKGFPHEYRIDEEIPLFYYYFTKVNHWDMIHNSLDDMILQDHVKDINMNILNERERMQVLLDLFVEYEANINETYITSRQGYAPIHIATISHNLKLLHWLIEKGANISISSLHEKYSSIQYAAIYGHVYIIAQLCRYELKKMGNFIDLNQQDANGHTLLHLSASSGQVYMIIFLLRIGVNKQLRDKQGRNASMLAIENGYKNIAEVILRYHTPEESYELMLDYHIAAYNEDDLENPLHPETNASSLLNESKHNHNRHSFLMKIIAKFQQLFRRNKIHNQV